MIIVPIAFGFAALWMVFMLFRNEWVYKQRSKFYGVEWDNLVSYDEMMRRFWVWDINKLKNK